MFYVVQLDSDVFKDRLIVPSIWLDKHNTLCLLPPTEDSAEVVKQAKDQISPKHGWQMHDILFIQSFDTYSEAEEHIKSTKGQSLTVEIEDESEVEQCHQSEERKSRKRKRPAFLENYTTEIDDDEDCNAVNDNNSSTEGNIVLPDPCIVKVEPLDESIISECLRKVQTDATDKDKDSPDNNTPPPRPHPRPRPRLLQNRERNASLAFDRVKTECACNSSCHKILLQSLLALQKQQQDTNRLMYQIIGQLKIPVSALNIGPGGPSDFPVTLPAKDLSGLELFNTYLSDPNNFNESISYFSDLGGSNPRRILKRLMEAFLNKELRSKLNWKGRGDKHPFYIYTNIHNLIYQVAKRNPKSCHFTVSDIENFIKNWLKMALNRSPKEKLNGRLMSDN